MYLTVSKAELGYPYRVRADYLSDSPENASSAGIRESRGALASGCDACFCVPAGGGPDSLMRSPVKGVLRLVLIKFCGRRCPQTKKPYSDTRGGSEDGFGPV
jgi:hypothetical protein